MPVKSRGKAFQASISIGGKRYRKDFPTEPEANSWIAEMETSSTPSKSTCTPTLGDFLNTVIQMRWAGTKAETTSTVNATQVVKVLNPNRLVSSLTKADAALVKAHFKAKAISDATVNRKLAAFSVLVKEAVEFGYLKTPFKVGLSKERQGRVRYLTEEEEQALLGWAMRMGESQFYAYLVISIDTGFRQGEVLKITLEDVGKDNLWTYDTKNGQSREVPLTDRAKGQLQALAGLRSDRKYKLIDLKPAALRDRWRKAQTSMGLMGDEEFVPHIMRHTFVTRLLESGVDIKTVQELAGHESIVTTQRYAHSSPERKTLAIQRMQGYQAA